MEKNLDEIHRKTEQAIMFVLLAFLDKKDKLGFPAVLHSLAVAGDSKLTTETEKIVAILHDVLEDTSASPEAIETLFGKEVLDAVQSMTKRKDEPYKEYLKRVAENPIALKVKICDVSHNVQRLWNLPREERERLTAKYIVAESFLYGRIRDKAGNYPWTHKE